MITGAPVLDVILGVAIVAAAVIVAWAILAFLVLWLMTALFRGAEQLELTRRRLLNADGTGTAEDDD